MLSPTSMLANSWQDRSKKTKWMFDCVSPCKAGCFDNNTIITMLQKQPSTPAQLTAKFRAYTEELRFATGPDDAWLVLKAPQRKKKCKQLLANDFRATVAVSDAASTTNNSDVGLETKFGQVPHQQRAGGAVFRQKLDPVSIQLHDLCAASNPSLEMMRIYISTYPWALKQKTANGALPLHTAIDKDDASCLVVCELLQRYPASASIRDGDGRLPLFIACSRSRAPASVIKAVYQAYPDAAITTSLGALPLHSLSRSGNATPEIVKLLLSTYPEAAATQNNFGNLPLHYMCAMENPSTESMRLLMAAHPHGVTCRNNYGETPIDRALAKYSNSEAIRERVRLLLRSADPSCLSRDQIELLHQLNWEARKIIILVCVHFVGQLMPNEKGLLHMYLACGGLWRHIIAYL